jgi:hypothetical protein
MSPCVHWPFATIRDDAATRSRSERSGHSASRAYKLDYEYAPSGKTRQQAARRPLQGHRGNGARGAMPAGRRRPRSRGPRQHPATKPRQPPQNGHACGPLVRYFWPGVPKYPPTPSPSHGPPHALPRFCTGKTPYLEQKWNKVTGPKPLPQCGD